MLYKRQNFIQYFLCSPLEHSSNKPPCVSMPRRKHFLVISIKLVHFSAASFHYQAHTNTPHPCGKFAAKFLMLVQLLHQPNQPNTIPRTRCMMETPGKYYLLKANGAGVYLLASFTTPGKRRSFSRLPVQTLPYQITQHSAALVSLVSSYLELSSVQHENLHRAW